MTDRDAAYVVDWYGVTLAAQGWEPTTLRYISMRDGTFPRYAWRRGDRFLGLGFPKRGRLRGAYPAGVLFELTITNQPEESRRSSTSPEPET